MPNQYDLYPPKFKVGDFVIDKRDNTKHEITALIKQGPWAYYEMDKKPFPLWHNTPIADGCFVPFTEANMKFLKESL